MRRASANLLPAAPVSQAAGGAMAGVDMTRQTSHPRPCHSGLLMPPAWSRPAASLALFTTVLPNITDTATFDSVVPGSNKTMRQTFKDAVGSCLSGYASVFGVTNVRTNTTAGPGVFVDTILVVSCEECNGSDPEANKAKYYQLKAKAMACSILKFNLPEEVFGTVTYAPQGGGGARRLQRLRRLAAVGGPLGPEPGGGEARSDGGLEGKVAPASGSKDESDSDAPWFTLRRAPVAAPAVIAGGPGCPTEIVFDLKAEDGTYLGTWKASDHCCRLAQKKTPDDRQDCAVLGSGSNGCGPPGTNYVYISIQAAAKLCFMGIDDVDNMFTNFACQQHDWCYSTPNGKTRQQCDKQMEYDMWQWCGEHYGGYRCDGDSGKCPAACCPDRGPPRLPMLCRCSVTCSIAAPHA